jgi:uncharacterized protein YecE (DUF72 family)
MSSSPLFDVREPFDRAGLAAKLKSLSERGVWIGTSSWKYPGWAGQIYSRDRYFTRSGFSQKRFEAECLREYAETFPAVCGDFSFYQFPPEAYWRKLFDSAPESLRFAFKVPEEITVKTYPIHPRYGPRAGLVNPSYLDTTLLRKAFLDPLRAYEPRVNVLIFEFGTFSQKSYQNVREFVQDLDRFLAALPRNFRYAVEVRNPEFLDPVYFHCLRAHGAAHVFNGWTRMPEIGLQMTYPDAFTSDFFVCRALLRQGRAYEDAVRLFSPYEEIKDPNPQGRQALRKLVDYALDNRQAAFMFVNNRFEGSAPLTIQAVVGG